MALKTQKENNLVYLAGDAYSDKHLTGDYYFLNPLPYPLPNDFKSLNGIGVHFNTGQNKGSFTLSGSNISHLSIDKVTGSNFDGNFSIVLNPTFSNGATDSSISIQMTGRFTVPYHYIP